MVVVVVVAVVVVAVSSLLVGEWGAREGGKAGRREIRKVEENLPSRGLCQTRPRRAPGAVGAAARVGRVGRVRQAAGVGEAAVGAAAALFVKKRGLHWVVGWCFSLW